MADYFDNTPRILTRGEESTFKVSFFADIDKTTPLIPINSDYPKYVIRDLDGTEIQVGVGTETSSGRYVASFLVPKDAPLSYFNQQPQQYNDHSQGMDLTANNSRRYQIEWMMLTAENYQINFVEEFDVKDIAITRSQNRELKYLTMSGKPVRVLLRVTELPMQATLTVSLRGGEDHPDIIASFDRSIDPPVGDLKYAKDGDSYVLYFDVPAGVTRCNTAYVVLWETKLTEFDVPEYQYQVITSISQNLLPWMTSLRMMIDKFQIRLGRIQSYEDSDLLEYLAEGLRLVNSTYPTTSYSMQSVPDDIMGYVLLAAGWYGLKAQQILNAQLNFSFSGQAVTLDVDNAAGLDSAAASMMELFNTNIGAVKMTYVRKERGLGTVGTRGLGYNRAGSMVFRIGNGSAPSASNWLVKIGLL